MHEAGKTLYWNAVLNKQTKQQKTPTHHSTPGFQEHKHIYVVVFTDPVKSIVIMTVGIW